MKPIEIQGVLYKIGRHNLVFKFIGNDWIRSTKTAAQIKSAIDNRRRRVLEDLFYGT
jgi:hypothetical protein